MNNRIGINTGQVRFDTAPELYGLFFEDINHAADGGLYPEMLRNRAFEDSLVPDGCRADDGHVIYLNEGNWPGAFNHGEGMDEWAAAVPPSAVPAWYAGQADFSLNLDDTLNRNRKAALGVHFSEGGFIENIGYFGVPVRQGDGYRFCCFLKSDTDCILSLTLVGNDSRQCSEAAVLTVGASSGYTRYDAVLKANDTDFNGKFRITCDRKADIRIGFSSLLPEKTFRGHGLREDLAQMLKNTHSSFIRFPGGCIVEGINEENAWTFHRSIGPVYERPSSQLMWHYRSTNSLGFHEYLQLCEDLDMDAMYVLNCGMSCQARHGHGFDDAKVREYLQDALDALEYALGSTDTVYGKMRMEAGHPEPFRLKYVEIGNENNGPEYLERYALFYRALKDAYPQVIYISNSHTEEQGLPTEIVDEHYYSTPEFFQESGGLFDDYDRNGPRIFVGEYAVNGGDTIASMECALAEGVFLTGAEKNQDIVRMAAYAPLFQNNDYTAWKPNLIVFNNHQVYGIPSYHVISLFGKYRGDKVVGLCNQSRQKPPLYYGIPGVQCEKDGLLFKNARVNGRDVDISKEIYGELESDGGKVFRMFRGQKRHRYTGKSPEWNAAFQSFREGWSLRGQPCAWVAFGQNETEQMTFEIDLKFDRDNTVTLSVWNRGVETDVGCNEPKDPEWDTYSVKNRVWRIADGVSMTRIPWLYEPPVTEDEKAAVRIDYEQFNHYEMRCDPEGYSCYINGQFVQRHVYRQHPLISASCETTDDLIYLKLVNVEKEAMPVTVALDCDIEKEIRTETVQASPESVNSFEDPLNVSPEENVLQCGGKEFVYMMQPYSACVLIMKKQK